MKQTFHLIFVLIGLSFLGACNEVSLERANKTITFDNPKPEVKIERFDQSVLAIDTQQVENGLALLQKQWPEFSSFYFGPEFMHIMDTKERSATNIKSLRGFLTHPPSRVLFDSIQVAYKNVAPLESDLADLMQAWNHFFPQSPQPKVIGVMSEFGPAVFTYGDSLVAFSMECFMRANHTLYKQLETPYPDYISRTLDQKHLPVFMAEAMINNRFGETTDNRLLGQMIWDGKCLYLLHQLLPNLPDSLLLKHNAIQTAWCFENEAQIWSFLMEDNLLYSTEQMKYRKLIDDAPHSPGMPTEAPGKTASFLGWRIVKQYMEKNKNTSIEQLFALQDSQALLNASGYKPKR